MIFQSKAAWQKRKRELGVPSGVCKTVDMGDAFEAFARDTPERYISNPTQTLAAIEALAPKLTTYTAELKRSHPTNPMVQELLKALKTLTSLKAQMASAAEPMRFLVQYHTEATRKLEVLKRDRVNKIKNSHWDAFYRGPIRNIGLQLNKLCKLEPQHEAVKQVWKQEMDQVNAIMNSTGLFQYAAVERILTSGLAQVQASLANAGAWPAQRGQVAGPAQAAPPPRPNPPNYPAPSPPAPNFQAPNPPAPDYQAPQPPLPRPMDGKRKPLPKPPRRF